MTDYKLTLINSSMCNNMPAATYQSYVDKGEDFFQLLNLSLSFLSVSSCHVALLSLIMKHCVTTHQLIISLSYDTTGN